MYSIVTWYLYTFQYIMIITINPVTTCHHTKLLQYHWLYSHAEWNLLEIGVWVVYFILSFIFKLSISVYLSVYLIDSVYFGLAFLNLVCQSWAFELEWSLVDWVQIYHLAIYFLFFLVSLFSLFYFVVSATHFRIPFYLLCKLICYPSVLHF